MSQPTFDRGRPNRLQRAFFRGPVRFYRGPVAGLLGSRCVLMLTTKGRKSGKPRTTGVSFMREGSNYIVFAGWGVRSNWYQNLLADPEVSVRVGSRQFAARAVPVADPERRKALMVRMQAGSGRCGPPALVRPILRATRAFDYDAELRLAVEQAGNLPVVELVPSKPSPAGSDTSRPDALRSR